MTDDLPDHTNYSLIKAVDESGNIVTVLVDSSGRMYAVMKGDYAGALKTLAVDDKGRIQAVLSDPEDVFGNPNYIGAGELAARLGSIKNFEHRGEVVWMDDFEGSVLRWVISDTGVGASVALSTERSLSGIQSAKLTTGTGSPRECYISRHLAAPRSSIVGFECAFTTRTYIDWLYFFTDVLDGSKYVYGAVKVDYDDDKIYYYVKTTGWVDTGLTPQLDNNDYLFRRLKFVYDYATLKWKRIYFDDEVVDLGDADMATGASASKKRMEITLQVNGDGVHNETMFIDNVIVTQNEP